MTQTAEAPSEQGQKKRSLASPLQSKPRVPVIAAAIALMVVFGLLFVWLLSSQTHTQSVFAARSDIARGHVITAEDLTAVEIPEGQPIPHFLTTQQSEVIGKTAAKDISSGGLVSPKTLATGTGLSEDDSVVGLSLGPAQLPPYPLRSGDRVRIVGTPPNQAEMPKEVPTPISATIVSTEKDTVSGQTLVAVQVPRGDAASLAAKAATGRVALILDGGN